ncbi:uncharacterized protein LOC144136293 [Amblyomma americanum]
MSLIKDRIVHSPYPDVEIPECTLYNFVAQALKKHGDKTAYIEGTKAISYAELLKMVRQFATGFQQSGVCRGDRVILALNNTTDGIIAILSLMLSGCVVCFCSGPRTKQELVYHVKDAKASFCLTDDESLASIVEQQSQCGFKKIFVSVDVPGYVSVSSFKQLPEMALETLQEGDTKKALCAIAYTSGTTGEPKGVMISQYSFVACIQNSLGIKCVEKSDIAMVLWVLISISSIRIFLNLMVLGCTTVVVKPKSGSKKLMEEIRRHNVSIVCASASPMSNLANDAHSQGEKLPCVRRTCSIGGSLLPSTVEKMRDVFQLVSLAHVYGLTEAAGSVLVPPIDALAVPFLGFACPNVVVKVVDTETRAPLPEGKGGEICFKIPSVMMGYLNKPEQTRKVIDSEGWVSSGDCGYYDAEGRVFYIDRLVDTVKCIGYHVPTAELEELIVTMHEVREAAVVGIQNTAYQDSPVAFVVLKEGVTAGQPLAQRIKKHVAERSPKHMHLYGGVVFLESLPKNNLGKVLKKDLRKMAVDSKTQRLCVE